MSAWEVLRFNIVQLGLWLDGGANWLACLLTGQRAFGGETLSAHAWRAREKPLGRVMRPLIDGLFCWQTPDLFENDGTPIKSHCERAFEKARLRMYLPEDYR